MIDEDVLEQRFWSIAEREAAQRSIEITQDGADYLKSFIHRGVCKLLADGSANDQSIFQAEENLIKFMTQTSALSKTLSEDQTRFKGPVFPELNKRILMQSIVSICPCWPFC